MGGVGALIAFNTITALTGGPDLNLWWLDLRALPAVGAHLALLLLAALLAAYAVRPTMGRVRCGITRVLVAAVALAAAINAARFAVLAGAGVVQAGTPIPFSLSVVFAALWTLPALGRKGTGAQASAGLMSGWPARLAAPVAALVILAGLPFAQMVCFGRTDYRRAADVAVVFGAGVYADGTLSLALEDRLRTGIGLYHEGLAARLILSGGPGPGPVHETDAMRAFALAQGVRPGDVLVDRGGLNTRLTARHVDDLCARHGFERVLAVSHFYHLPRVKLAFQRCGREVYTVPARESRPLRGLPYYMAREAAAIWFYYLLG